MKNQSDASDTEKSQQAVQQRPAQRRIDLSVPFADNKQVKALGARWDGATRTWFVSAGADLTPFSRWIPPEPRADVWASSYYIAESFETCWKCGATSSVVAACLPDGHHQLAYDEYEPERRLWLEDEGFVSFVRWMPKAVGARFGAVCPKYRLDFSKTAGNSYWMNHCSHCDAKLGDFPMFNEPGGPFHPTWEGQARTMRLTHVAEPYEARGSLLIGDFWCASMERRSFADVAQARFDKP